MLRKIIEIDESKCDGCGLCAEACHEGAIGIVNGKAKLLRDDYCDGLGDCLPACPRQAISFVTREAAAYDEAAVLEHMKRSGKAKPVAACPGGGCPGSRMRQLKHDATADEEVTPPLAGEPTSELAQWPVQLKLVPANAAFFDGAKLLVAADCTAFAYANIHRRFMRGKVTLIGCPKLDGVDYSEKLTDILTHNDIKSVTVLRMEVPCCGGIEMAVKHALQKSGTFIPWQVVTVGINGEIKDQS